MPTLQPAPSPSCSTYALPSPTLRSQSQCSPHSTPGPAISYRACPAERLSDPVGREGGDAEVGMLNTSVRDITETRGRRHRGCGRGDQNGTDLNGPPVSVHLRRLFACLFEQFLLLFSICFEEIVVYPPSVASILLKQCEIIVPIRMDMSAMKG